MLNTKTFNWGVPVAVFVVSFAAFLIYALKRYVIYGNMELETHLLFLCNKALAMSAVSLISSIIILNAYNRIVPESLYLRHHIRKHFGIITSTTVVLHIFISILLFSPANFPKLFNTSGGLHYYGAITLIFGVIAFLMVTAIDHFEGRGLENTLIFLMLHLAVMSYKGWFAPVEWPGNMIPLSLIAFSMLFIVLIVDLVSRILKRK